MVKRVLRVLLLLAAIATGIILGDRLLAGFTLSNMCFFGGASAALGFVFYRIDQKIMEMK